MTTPTFGTQALRFTLILLSTLTLSMFTPVSVAQTQDYSRVNLPDGAIVRLGKGGVSYEDRGIAFSPDGSRLAVATSIGIWLYDVETFDELALLTGHTGETTAVAFSPDGTKLAAGVGADVAGNAQALGCRDRTKYRHIPRTEGVGPALWRSRPTAQNSLRQVNCGMWKQDNNST